MGVLKRVDWLKEFQIGMGVIGAALGLQALYYAVSDLWGLAFGDSYVPVVVTVPVEVGGRSVVEAGAGLAGRAELIGNGEVDVVIADPTTGEYLLHLLSWAPTAAVFLTLTILMFNLIRRARKTDPFTMATARSLNRIGVISLVGGSLAVFVKAIANFLLSEGALVDAISGVIELPWAWALGGLAILAIAAVIRHGAALREELDGVV